MSNLSFRRFAAAVAVIACVLSMTAVVDAKPCLTSGGNCRASTTITVYTPQPGEIVPFCAVGEPLYKVRVIVTCRSGAPVTEYKIVCSILAEPVVVNAGGQTHYLAPDSGSTWADVLADCGYLIHKVK